MLFLSFNVLIITIFYFVDNFMVITRTTVIIIIIIIVAMFSCYLPILTGKLYIFSLYQFLYLSLSLLFTHSFIRTLTYFLLFLNRKTCSFCPFSPSKHLFQKISRHAITYVLILTIQLTTTATTSSNRQERMWKNLLFVVEATGRLVDSNRFLSN